MSVMTVLGPVEGDALGRVDAHEHLFLRSPVLPGEEFQDLDRMVQEVRWVRESGIDTIVDLTPIGLGRKPSDTAELSRQTGVNVVLATGIHRKAHYPAGHWVHTLAVDELADLMVTDIETGIDDRDWQGPRPLLTEVRAGIVKLGASYHVVQSVERRWFEAGAQAAVRTGVAGGRARRGGHGGARDPRCLGGGRRRADPGDAGAHGPQPRLRACTPRSPLVERSSATTPSGARSTTRTRRCSISSAAVDALGHGGQVLLGTDVGRRGMLRAYAGGPGMDVLGRTFVPRLRRDLGEAVEQAVMVDNPRRFLAGVNP